MATIVRCDQCKKEAAIRGLDTVPPTWIEITEFHARSTPNEHHHVCSRACGIALLSLTRDDDHARSDAQLRAAGL